MTQRDRWLACDGYTIELEDGRLVPLQDLHTRTGARQHLSFGVIVRSFIGRLLTPSTGSSFRCGELEGGRRVGPHAQEGARTAMATAAYRTDAALGHLAGEEVPAAVRPVPAARPDDTTQIAA